MMALHDRCNWVATHGMVVGLDEMAADRQESPVLPDEKLKDLRGSISHEVGGQHGEQALYGLPDGLVGCSGLLISVQADSILSEEGVCKGPEGLINLAKFSQPCDAWQVLCFCCTRSCEDIHCIREDYWHSVASQAMLLPWLAISWIVCRSMSAACWSANKREALPLGRGSTCPFTPSDCSCCAKTDVMSCALVDDCDGSYTSM